VDGGEASSELRVRYAEVYRQARLATARMSTPTYGLLLCLFPPSLSFSHSHSQILVSNHISLDPSLQLILTRSQLHLSASSSAWIARTNQSRGTSWIGMSSMRTSTLNIAGDQPSSTKPCRLHSLQWLVLATDPRKAPSGNKCSASATSSAAARKPQKTRMSNLLHCCIEKSFSTASKLSPMSSKDKPTSIPHLKSESLKTHKVAAANNTSREGQKPSVQRV